MTRHRSSAVPLAWLYAALIVYASLYPFFGWRMPGFGPLDYLALGWPRWWTSFDFVANFLGYLPFGFLLFVALLRGGRSARRSTVLAVLLGTGLSFAMETLQTYLPHRVASNVDLGLNALGVAVGAGIGYALQWQGGIERWQRIRERWFVARSAGGAALLVLWPIGLLFPTAVPFGLGHVLGRAATWLAAWLADTPLEGLSAGRLGLVDRVGTATADAAPAVAPTAATLPAALLPTVAMAPAAELAIVVLGLLAPCLVGFTVAVAGWRRALLVAGAIAVGCATTTLSTALNFGPQHAFAWTTPLVMQGVAVAAIAAMLLSFVPGRVAAGFGLIALTAMVMLVAQAPADPYFAQSLQGWEQGRFIRFHGAAQWVGWAWPYAALIYLLVRIAVREPRGRGKGPTSRIEA